jgi:hypothetical protein
MWNRNRVWTYYIKDIVAADKRSAILLATYMKRVSISKEYIAALEIFDLQKYKVIRDAARIKGSFREKLNKPFIFIACKN